MQFNVWLKPAVLSTKSQLGIFQFLSYYYELHSHLSTNIGVICGFVKTATDSGPLSRAMAFAQGIQTTS